MRLKIILFFILTSLTINGFSQSDTLQNHPDTLTFSNDLHLWIGDVDGLAYQFEFPDSIDSFDISEILFSYSTLVDTGTFRLNISIGNEPQETILSTFHIYLDSMTTPFPNWSSFVFDSPIKITNQKKFYIGGWGLDIMCNTLGKGSNYDFYYHQAAQNKWAILAGYLAIKVVGNLYYTDINENSNRPDDFTLFQNYPNPFNPSTTIKYSLQTPANVDLYIFNASGQQLYHKYYARRPAGINQIKFDGSDLSSGTYFYQIHSNGKFETKKFILLK